MKDGQVGTDIWKIRFVNNKIKQQCLAHVIEGDSHFGYPNGGQLFTCSQVGDYKLHGQEFEEMCMLDFVVNTYEEGIPQHKHEHTHKGCPRNKRSGYILTHPKRDTHHHVHRTAGHHTLPDIVGPFFPNPKGEKVNLYFMCVLALLRPWCTVDNIKRAEVTFERVYRVFYNGASKIARTVISGIQYHYECKNAAIHKGMDSDTNNFVAQDNGGE